MMSVPNSISPPLQPVIQEIECLINCFEQQHPSKLNVDKLRSDTERDPALQFQPVLSVRHSDKDSASRPVVSILSPLPMIAIPDLKLFENMEVVEHCKGFHSEKDDDQIESEEQSVILCPAVKRLVAVLNYYNSLMMNSSEKDKPFVNKTFIEFCDVHYGAYWMMEDHIHIMTNHSDLASTSTMATALKWKCFGDLKQCQVIRRHYRNPRQCQGGNVHFYIDMMDSLHFNVLHLVDVGLRVNQDDDVGIQDGEDSLVDPNMLKIAQYIYRKRQQCFFERLDGMSKNSKFSLCCTEKSKGGVEGRMTKMDSVLKDFQKEAGDEAAVHRLVEFMKYQRYDTETMNEDMAIYAESKQCNIRKAMEAQGDGEGFGAMRRWLRYHRVSGSSFSTGIWWAYWPWYRTQTVESLINNSWGWWRNVDFGGYSLESLCVNHHFDNLKEEALGSKLICAQFWTRILEKARLQLKSTRCKKMVDHHGYLFEFDLPEGAKVTVQHLIALLLYTDSSEYCTALSETHRAIETNETIGEMNSRNSKFYWSSRYLRELVLCFGANSDKEKMPFFTGVSHEMQIPQFQISLIGPTSTSTAKEVAVRFAGEEGMLLVLQGGSSRYFDASVFSGYPEEQERIFCGSVNRDTVTSIVLVKTARNYRAAAQAYSKFDALLSGQPVRKISPLETDIIKESLRWVTGGDDAVSHKNLDIFILETFYSFIIHKKMVHLHLEWFYKFKNNQIVNMIMNPLWNNKKNAVGNEPMNANLMKPFVFRLFREVHQIRIWAKYYPFDLVAFLKMLQSADMPQTLEVIIVSGWDWIDEGFSENVKEKYNEKGIIGNFQNFT